VQGWVHHTRINGALGLFVNRTGGCWAQNNGGWALLMKQVRKGGARMGVRHTQTDGALGLFVNQAGGCWTRNDGGSALLMKQVRKGDGSAAYTNRWCTGPCLRAEQVGVRYETMGAGHCWAPQASNLHLEASVGGQSEIRWDGVAVGPTNVIRY